MSFKTILLSLNQVSRSDTLINSAVSLAAAHEAHLIGLYIIPAPRIYPAMSAHVTPVVLDEAKVFFEERAKTCQETFNEAARKAGIELGRALFELRK